MLLIAIIIGFSLGTLLLRRKIPAGKAAEAAEPSALTVRASVDGKPVRSYVADRPR